METPRGLSTVSNSGEPRSCVAGGGTDSSDVASLTDGRQPGDYGTKYLFSAWVHIFLELTYLLAILAVSLLGLALLAIYVDQKQQHGFIFGLIGPLPNSLPLVCWASMCLSGVCGGCCFSLKWLYHAVAKRKWHRDRTIWRGVVPVLSGVLAVFSGLMIVAGLVPFFAKTPLTVPVTAAGYGFFVGFLSDNLIAALQRIATHVFGTASRSE